MDYFFSKFLKITTKIEATLINQLHKSAAAAAVHFTGTWMAIEIMNNILAMLDNLTFKVSL